ncbi:MAG: alpha/beta fold hydrolase [Patescibacteria group bacterium]|nr:alpha/beta fold hydrolase [Patescibacteria group bacterium]
MRHYWHELHLTIKDQFMNIIGWIKTHDLGFSNATDTGPVVILVGGYAASVYHFIVLKKKELEDAGFNVFVFDPGVNYNRSVEDLGRELGKFAKKVLKASKAKKFAIVAHSLGGLISQYYLEREGGDKYITKIVTAGSPFNGTRAALLLSHTRAAREMIPGSKFLKSLQSNLKFSGRIVSIRAKRDQTIWPKASSILEGAKNIESDVVGHNTLMKADEVFRIIKKELK